MKKHWKQDISIKKAVKIWKVKKNKNKIIWIRQFKITEYYWYVLVLLINLDSLGSRTYNIYIYLLSLLDNDFKIIK